MTTFTVEVQASNTDGTAWQALEPAEFVDTSGWGANWTAEQVAQTTAEHQTIAEKPYRIAVWEGRNVDAAAEPSYVLDVEVEPDDLLTDVRCAARRAAVAIAKRDELIRAAMARTDIPRAALADSAGVTEARLYQIRDGK